MTPGDLCADLNLGGRYRVIGQLIKHADCPSRVVLEAASVRSIPLSIYAQPLACAISPVSVPPPALRVTDT